MKNKPNNIQTTKLPESPNYEGKQSAEEPSHAEKEPGQKDHEEEAPQGLGHFPEYFTGGPRWRQPDESRFPYTKTNNRNVRGKN